MDADAVNAKGGSPIAAELAEVDAISSITDFTSTLSQLEARGVSGIFGTFIYKYFVLAAGWNLTS
jgi:predicted metalloendopeptidase